MRCAIFDTETTGLIKNSLVPLEKQPYIIEFYGNVIEIGEEGSFEKIRELEFFAKPPVPISEEITRITGIKPSDVKDANPFKDHANDINRFFHGVDFAVAHNMSFDKAMVANDMKRAGAELHWPERVICTVEATEHIKGHRLKLSDLHEHLFGEPFVGAHRARVDVEALTRCFVELVRRGEV